MELKGDKIKRYIRRAEIAAESSPDLETKVGAILVSSKTQSVVSEGYNGFIRGAKDDVLPRTRPDKHKFIIHAEANLLANAARNGVSTSDCFVVQTISPCINCARLLFQAGIKEIYFKEWYGSDLGKLEIGDLKTLVLSMDGYYLLQLHADKECSWNKT